jgi:hypothetical protein
MASALEGAIVCLLQLGLEHMNEARFPRVATTNGAKSSLAISKSFFLQKEAGRFGLKKQARISAVDSQPSVIRKFTFRKQYLRLQYSQNRI